METGTSSAPLVFIGNDAAMLLFYFSAFIFALYSLVIAYHWLRYGYTSKLAIPALAVYGIVSVGILLLIASGLP